MTALLVPLVPVLGMVGVFALRTNRRAAAWTAFATMLATLAVAAVAAAQGAEYSWAWGAGLRLQLAAVGFARILAVLVPAVAAPVLLYATTSEALEPAPLARLLGSLCGFVGAMELLVLAEDLLTLLIGWELIGAFSWLLIGFHWRDAGRPRAAGVAFLTTRFGDLGLYLAAAAAFSATGSLDYAALGRAEGTLLHVMAGGVLLAAAAKSAQLPFSPWLFSAMAGPTPVSALLHSATLVAAGAYALVRLAPVFEPTGWFGPAAAALGLSTVVAGGVVALVHTDVKKALAASTSSQYGLMFAAVGAGSTAAAGAHLVAHAFFKSLLFLGAGVAIHAAGTGDLRRLRLGRALPLTAVLFAAGALSLAAVPPLGGAFTKERIVDAGLAASPLLGLALVASGLLTAAYAARLLLLGYGPGERREAPGPTWRETAGMAALALPAVLMSLLWLPGAARLAEAAIGGELGHGETWVATTGVIGVLAAAGASWFLWRRGSLVTLGLPERLRAGVADWLGIPGAARRTVVVPVSVAAVALARFDDRVVDAGVRAAGRFGRLISRVFSFVVERRIDGVVEGVRGAAIGAAHLSRRADDRGLDAAVEGIARATGVAGSASRRLQTGMTHHYYLIVAGGLLAMLAIVILWR
jgi:NADH:ubiquinone oxidoreductase subunit 5 (subunit L)/multisubunit Na+/H+ antiporter MnhA subunit